MFEPITADNNEPVDRPMIKENRGGMFSGKPSDFGAGKAMPQGNKQRNRSDDFGGTAEMRH
jgi:hypothetical protein